MKKKIVSVLLMVTMLSSMSLGVFAAEPTASTPFQSTLPQSISLDVTFDQIQENILQYINSEGLNIEVGTPEYLDFMNRILFDEDSFNLDETTLRYFGNYAARYVIVSSENSYEENANSRSIDNEAFSSELSKSLLNVKEENEAITEEMVTTVETVATPRAAYNVAGAQAYAKKYATSRNLMYGYFPGADCTNFASQVVYEGGGVAKNQKYWNQSSAYQIGRNNWNVAGAFTQYMSLERGYLGGEYLYRSQVNANANPGDCIAYKMKDTYDIYHVAFVQSKSNGLIYCTQHTSDYYNLKFNDRVSESYMSSRLVIVIDFTK